MNFKQECSEFYDANYRASVRARFGRHGRQVVWGNPSNTTCRFCKKSKPEVSFDSIAHAIPESIGNRHIVTTFECDSCNQTFGDEIEHHFGLWSNYERVIGRVPGKRGIPKLDRYDWHIRNTDEGVTEFGVSDELKVERDESEGRITITATSAPYVPIAVLKAFHKMALSLMQEHHANRFDRLCSWILNRDHKQLSARICTTVIFTTIQGVSIEPGEAYVYNRSTADQTLPFITFLVGFGFNFYQIFLLEDSQSHLPSFEVSPFPIRDSRLAPSYPKTFDLSGTAPVIGGSQSASFIYDPATFVEGTQ
ncbi:MAG TPA: HNH endonuclease [Planktothrix sp.]|jgi:hypothetical protein